MDNYPSKLLESAISELGKLPGVGKRTALRFALHILKQEEEDAALLAQSIFQLRSEIKYCKSCYSISDTDLCEICNNTTRDKTLLCVVENIRDIMAIESTRQYKGLYHVLGGVLSPIEGIGINDLNIVELLKKMEAASIQEIVLALPTTMEGDTTSFYLHKQLKRFDVKISTIARGIAIGDSLEFADEITLGRSIINRMPFEGVYGMKA